MSQPLFHNPRMQRLWHWRKKMPGMSGRCKPYCASATYVAFVMQIPFLT